MRNDSDRHSAHRGRPDTGETPALGGQRSQGGEATPAPSDSMAYYSRTHAESRYNASHASRRRRTTITRSAFIALGGVVVLGVAGTAAWANSFIHSVGDRMNARVEDSTRSALAKQQEEARARAASSLSEDTTNLPDNWQDTTPFYMLLIGTDRSSSRTEGDESYLYGESDANFRSDVMILARIDPGNKIVTMVSIHRDTIVNIDGTDMKINAAYSLGGVSKVIEVVSNFAGVPISHYAEVDIDGLAAVTDAMGGVTVDVPYTIDDPLMGYMPSGLQTLNGDQALILCRSRHAFDYMGDGDRYRAAHQRLFLTAMASQLFQSSVQTMVSVINTVADYITTDFTVDQIISLALTMRDMDTANGVYSTMNPTTTEIIGGTYYELSDDEQWAYIMSMVDAGEKPPVDYGYLDPLNDVNAADDGGNSTTVTEASNPYFVDEG